MGFTFKALQRLLPALVLAIAVTAGRAEMPEYDPELIRSAQRVHAGTASEADILRVRLRNRELNEMAVTGYKGPDGKPAVPNDVYQSVQQDYSGYVESRTVEHGRQRNVEVTPQARNPDDPYAPMTDSDLLSNANNPDDVRGIRQGLQDDFEGMERRLADLDKKAGRQTHAPRNTDYLDHNEIDVMTDPDGISPENFDKVGDLNKEPYKRPGAARYEKISRGGDSQGRTDLNFDEISDMTDEMNEKIEKKGKRVEDILADPEARKNSNRLQADIQEAAGHEAKYLDRLDKTSANTANRYGVDGPSEAVSDMVGKGKVRGPDTVTEGAIVHANRDHYRERGMINQSEVLGDVAKTGQESADAVADRIARNAEGLSDSAKGELLEKVRQRNPELAADVAARLRGEAPGSLPDGPRGQPDHVFGDDAKWTKLDADAPGPRKPDMLGAAAVGVDLGITAGEASARALGQALDENRDMNAGDAGKVLAAVTGVEAVNGIRQATTDMRVQKGVDAINARQEMDRIRSKDGPLTAADRQRLAELEQVANADNIVDNVGDLGSAMIVEPGKEIVGRRIQEMEDAAAAEGRDVEFGRDFVPAAAKIGAEMVGSVTPIKTVADWAAEMSTYEERADWAAQKDAMVQWANGKAVLSNKKIGNLSRELETLANGADPNDPATAARLDAILAEMQAEQDSLRNLQAVARRRLGEVDPDDLKTLDGLANSQPDVPSMRDYADQMLRDRGGQGFEDDGAGDSTLPDDALAHNRSGDENVDGDEGVDDAISDDEVNALLDSLFDSDGDAADDGEGDARGLSVDMDGDEEEKKAAADRIKPGVTAFGDDFLGPDGESSADGDANGIRPPRTRFADDFVGGRDTADRMRPGATAFGDDFGVRDRDRIKPDATRFADDFGERDRDRTADRIGPRATAFGDDFRGADDGTQGSSARPPRTRFADDFGGGHELDELAAAEDGFDDADDLTADDSIDDIAYDNPFDGIDETGNTIAGNVDLGGHVSTVQGIADRTASSRTRAASTRDGGGQDLVTTRTAPADDGAADVFGDSFGDSFGGSMDDLGRRIGDGSIGDRAQDRADERARQRAEEEAARRAAEEEERRRRERARQRDRDNDDDDKGHGGRRGGGRRSGGRSGGGGGGGGCA